MTKEGKIVVIGGGMAGYSLLRKLQKAVDPNRLLLIEPRDYVEVPFAVLRGLMDPSGLGRIIRKPISELTSVEQITAKAREIQGNRLTLEDGSTVSFAAAVVATGSVTSGHPFIKGGGARTAADREAEFEAEAARIRRATSVLLEVRHVPTRTDSGGRNSISWLRGLPSRDSANPMHEPRLRTRLLPSLQLQRLLPLPLMQSEAHPLVRRTAHRESAP